MSQVCQVTGRAPGFGNRVAHSNKRTKRRWNPNLQRRRYWLPSAKRWVTLTVSAKGIKTIDKRGIESVVAELRRKGVRI
ncbi:50S ribosomal protein L28 [Sciscionella sediminilitoris]|uniref:50S ribosomal protein L28 n=1 Tax=Sciscionella sediminilitoris TaxID=1445613 RepID=UPI0004DFCB57|nr:50S ribosomal protein L28 [Sciscionella sp. SE31]